MEPEKADNSLMNLSLCYERKPQFEFKCVLADNSFSPFEHLNVSSSTEKCHPFRKEIGALIDNPPEHSFWTSFTKEDTSKDCMWVDSSLQLRELANKLAEQNVFAVDTEQQNLRSYLGFTALMQISTREEDYLVDTVALHDEMALLRPIFSNPRICKVFHGAQNDIIWLQKDFHIYLVNIFDTYTACLLLEKSQKSLEVVSSVLSMLNLSLQTRDWTERPLPPTMLRYARTDTQYLLWIADVLTAELKEVKKYDESIRRSNKVCLTLYAKGQEDFKLANREQYDCRELAWKLCIWRDLMARIHDESREFVLSNEVMLKFARKVPTTYDVFKSTDDADQRIGGKFDKVSAIFLCHYDVYFNQIMRDKSVALDTAFPLILQKCLGMNGTCIPIRKPDVAVLKFMENMLYRLQLKTETLGGPEKVEKKKDLCNSCGKEGIELNRHRIVPPSYRKYFTETLKMDQSRDMVWLCQKCQKIALEAGERYKKTMSSRCEVSQSSHQKMVEAKEYVNIRRAAAALLDRPTIPESRREEYMEIVERHYGRSNLSREDFGRSSKDWVDEF
ncbi:hypothetical protein HID58_088175 [Brassica napus]|uniref:3'-5' exonuclease domain-containing protein n=1 Tax=Brassica napus TaxID=3708 RepID=A0ABQ7XVF0_BRANA|nr:hypothetical protein HID58_088175 [Brassica napus]